MNVQISEYGGFRDQISNVVTQPEIGMSIGDANEDEVVQNLWMLQELSADTGFTSAVRESFVQRVVELVAEDTSPNHRREVLAIVAIGTILDEVGEEYLNPSILAVLADLPIHGE